ncbi:MAG: undecaprenyl-diphosphate phosphatase, partial [bacterium]|nr:undecaprenyl-diphosphate phosphatase [bacterium]
MNLIHVLILSIVEGITEFLPISSTGHLILVSRILNLESSEFLKTFEIAIQLGAIMAVVALYYKKFLNGSEIYKKLFVAFLPAAIVGFTLFPLIKGVFLGSSIVTLIALFFGGVALIVVEKFLTRFPILDSSPREPTYRQALLIGVFQSFSIVPGVS